jgi:hypothetical protein
MDIAGIQNGVMGMALFDMWYGTVQKAHRAEKAKGSPLLAAASDAFEAYVQTAEVGFAAQIAGTAMYALNPGGNSTHAVTAQDIAPFLALNVMG